MHGTLSVRSVLVEDLPWAHLVMLNEKTVDDDFPMRHEQATKLSVYVYTTWLKQDSAMP